MRKPSEKSTVKTKISDIKPAEKIKTAVKNSYSAVKGTQSNSQSNEAVEANGNSYYAEKNTRSNNQTHEVGEAAGALFRVIAGMENRQTVIVCFGTTAISGDALGPAVGNLLRDKYKVPAFVYGTQEHQVNGKNMGKWLEFIKTVHEGALFIAVDASLGGGDKVGQIVMRSDGVCPAAIKGKKDRFGDVGILGVVAKNTSDPLMQLMTVSPLYISQMADKISLLIKNALI